MSSLFDDLRHAFRTLCARAGFTLSAVLTLALGIGVNAIIFSVVDVLLLQPLPYADAARLVSIRNTYPMQDDHAHGTTVPDYLDARAQAGSLADAAVYQYATFNLITATAPIRLGGLRATPSLFSTLGVPAALGRALIDDDAEPGKDRVVVLGHTTWQDQFAADPAIVGRSLTLDGETYRVVGVMPAGFYFPSRDVGVWAPYTISAAQREDAERGHSDISAIGRLKPGASATTLETEFRAITARNAARSSALRKDYAQTGFATRAIPLAEARFGGLRPTLWLLQGMAALVLLITIFNVANLLLARDASRQREFAVRAALGARRSRLHRQIAVDVGLLAAAGGLAGLLVARLGLPLLDRFGLASDWQWYGLEAQVGAATVAFTLAVTLLLGLLLGAAAALALRRGRGFDVLRSASRTSTAAASSRSRSALVVAQFALMLVLLAAAGLLLKSFVRLQRVDPGFVSGDLLTLRLSLPAWRYADDAGIVRYCERLLAAARATSGVEKAAYTSSLPFDGHLGTSGFRAEGYTGDDADRLVAERQSVDADYFTTLGVPLIEGRAFNAGDGAASSRVVVVDETLARHLWPGQSALGRRLRGEDEGSPWMTVVGVARAVHQNSLVEHAELGAMYWPYAQVPARFGELVVRSTLPASALIPALRTAALGVDAQLPLYDAQTLDERIAQSLDGRRTPMVMLGAFAALALLLAAIGLYGVVAFLTQQRTAELGVRMAIGASKREVLRLVLRAGLRLCAAGIAAGAIGAFAAGRLLRAQLVDVDAADPAVFGGVVLVLVAVALLASWLPARRAARIDPAVALRDQ